MIIYTCPTCGCDLQEFALYKFPLEYQRICPNCGFNVKEPVCEEDIVRIPYEDKRAAFELLRGLNNG